MGLKQKIRQGKAIHLKCGTPISLLPLGWFCTTCSSYIDKSIVVRIEDVDKLLDEAFRKCAYVDYNGKPVFLCSTCSFYHGMKKGCLWEEDRKKIKWLKKEA
jgi:hypothetical protein